MKNLPRENLRKIIAEYGHSLCNDPKKCSALLFDYCPEHRGEINVLINALKEGCVADLIGWKDRALLELLFVRLTERLCDNLKLDRDAARWGIETWAFALEMVVETELTQPKLHTKTTIPKTDQQTEKNLPLCQNCGAKSPSMSSSACRVRLRVIKLIGWLEIEAFGSKAEEVRIMTQPLIDKLIERNTMPKKTKSNSKKSSWGSGSFYLATIVIVGCVYLIAAKMLNAIVLPIVIVGSLLGVSVVGALQLRQDKSLSEKSFLDLMFLTFRQIPFFRPKDSEKNDKIS